MTMVHEWSVGHERIAFQILECLKGCKNIRFLMSEAGFFSEDDNAAFNQA